MHYDAICIGPQGLCSHVDSLSALYANRPKLPVVCTNSSIASPNSPLLAPYIVQKVETQNKTVFIGLISKSYETEISALELVCTGQVYLPTITFVMGVDGMRVNALAYMILYNLMFITPLLVTIGFVYWGTTTMQLGGTLQRHLIPVKLGTGVLLLGLGLWLLVSIV